MKKVLLAQDPDLAGRHSAKPVVKEHGLGVDEKRFSIERNVP
jgi:hypothetical protein